jgi:hypothetical protein
MSNKATVYPDIESLLRQIQGMRVKLAEAKTFRANYQVLRMLYREERGFADLYRGWADKLERVLKDIAEDIEGDAFDLRKFATKVIESKPAKLGS